MIYGDCQKTTVSNLVYRLSNWIPEIIKITDIGNSLSSFDKL